jgi:anti-sigma regulatory factor (Ser/Thr protein kinase)
MRGYGVFLISRCMDNLYLNRMNSRQGIVKKEQGTIFEI